MKIIVDIENKTLRMLENDRAIFKGEYGADKLILLLTKPLVSEYPVITGLLSNGRKIGGYTTDSSYGTERIDGVTYTTAEFTLSKENGFTLSEGVMQITVWIYKTVNSEVVSKTAIGNITFNVVNTTSFNDGDIIIAGDVEGTVVNLKVEVENLQRVAQTNNVAINKLNNDLNDYLPLNGEKSMTGDLKMKDNKIIFEENGKIAQSINNNLNEYTFPKESGELALNKNIPTKTSQLTNDSGFALKTELLSIDYNDLINTPVIDLGALKKDFKDVTNDVLNKRAGIYTFTYNKKTYIMISDAQPNNITQYIYVENEYYIRRWGLHSDTTIEGPYLIATKEEIPTKVSRLDNDSGFITNAVNNLTNYYLKSETYTKSEVQQLLSTISSLKLEVVANLPTTNISSNTIYLKPLDSAKENNIYEEYIYINNKWETIGTTAVDLTNYALKTDIPTKTSQLINDFGDLRLVGFGSTICVRTPTGQNVPSWGIGTDITFGQRHIKGVGTYPLISNEATTKQEFIWAHHSQYNKYAFPGKDGTIALVDDIPTKISDLEQDVELGVSEEDVMNIINENAEQTETLEVENATEIPIGTSETFNPEIDEQIPTSKAVADNFQSKLTAGTGINIANNFISFNHETLLEKYRLNKTIYDDDEANVNLLFVDNPINIVKPFKVELFDNKLHIYFTPMYCPYSESLDIQVCVYDNVHKTTKEGCIWGADSKLFVGYSIHSEEFDLTLSGQKLDEYGITPDGSCYLITEYDTLLVDPNFIYEM